MSRDAKIWIAGHSALYGPTIVRNVCEKGYTNVLARTHAELDLNNQQATDLLFASENPDRASLSAAKVGVIHTNIEWPAEFIRHNLAIRIDIVDAAYHKQVAHSWGCFRSTELGPWCLTPLHNGIELASPRFYRSLGTHREL